MKPRIATILAVAGVMALGACSDQIHLGSAPPAADAADATPAPPYWFADFETGDLSQWQEGGTSAGGQLSTLDAQLSVVTSPTPHGGRFAASSAIFAAGRQSYARLFRAGNLPNDLYFRVWMWIRQPYTIKQYWNVFEFQGRTNPADPGSYVYLWSLDLQTSNGEMSWYVFDTPHGVQYDPSVTTVAPIGRWFLVEAFMHQATDNTGQVTFWIDGNLLKDVTGVSTVPTMWLSWNVGGSSPEITEQPAEIFLDDAEIALTGPEKL